MAKDVLFFVPIEKIEKEEKKEFLKHVEKLIKMAIINTEEKLCYLAEKDKVIVEILNPDSKKVINVIVIDKLIQGKEKALDMELLIKYSQEKYGNKGVLLPIVCFKKIENKFKKIIKKT